MKQILRWSFSFLVLLASTSSFALDPIAPQLRAHVEKSRSNFGELPSWQEEIFQSEVVPSSGRFIRDYKTSGGTVTKVDVDLEGIKRYLSFSSSQILKPEMSKIVLFVRSTGQCADCAKAIASVRDDFKSRFERRGLAVILPTGDELKREPSEIYSQRNAGGWALAEVRAEDDPDHPGDQRYSLLLDVRFPGTIASSVQKQMEILPSDSIEVAMSRLAIDTFFEIGNKVRTGFALANADAPGIELSVGQLPQFAFLSQIKTKVQSAIGTDYRVVERRVERGRATLAILAGPTGDISTRDLVEQIRKIQFEGFSLHVLNQGESKVDVVVKSPQRSGAS